MPDKKEAWGQKVDAEDEDIDENNYKSQRDALLFAIDVSETMLAPLPTSDSKKPEKDSSLSAALKCAYQIMQQRIISSPKDMMGILLFGTEESKFQDDDPDSPGGLAYPHCYRLTDLDIPAAEDVKALKMIVEDEEEGKGLLVPTKEVVLMSNVLFCANQIFASKAPNFGSRRLFIITDKDDLHADDRASRSTAAVRAKDLYDLGVIIELFPISRLGHEFDRTKFYDDIIYRDPSDPDAPALSPVTARPSGADGISLLNSLISNINSKNFPKRALFSNLPLEIGPGLRISVKGYNILDRQKPARKSYVWLNGERAEIAIGETIQMAEESTRTVSKAEIKKAYRFGGEQVLFGEAERKELKNFGPPILRIVGFKPQSMLPAWASVSKSTFIYPSEDDYVGSTRVFAALWQKLDKDKKMGLAWYIPRVNANPLLVALLPSQERLDQHTKQQVIPAGLWAYPMPYADDIRYLPEMPPPVVSPEKLIDLMRVVVQQLQLPGARFDPAKYPNPSLQWHYRILQAMALDEEIPEFKESDDKTIARHRQIDKRAGHYVVQWGTALEDEYRTRATAPKTEVGGVGTKREAKREAKREVKREAEDEKGGASKKARTHGGPGTATATDMSTEQLKGYMAAGTMGKATVAELKAWLGRNGLQTEGRKAELVERVEQWFERR